MLVPIYIFLCVILSWRHALERWVSKAIRSPKETPSVLNFCKCFNFYCWVWKTKSLDSLTYVQTIFLVRTGAHAIAINFFLKSKLRSQQDFDCKFCMYILRKYICRSLRKYFSLTNWRLLLIIHKVSWDLQRDQNQLWHPGDWEVIPLKFLSLPTVIWGRTWPDLRK